MILGTTLETVPGTVWEVVRKVSLIASLEGFRLTNYVWVCAASRTATVKPNAAVVHAAIWKSTSRAFGRMTRTVDLTAL